MNTAIATSREIKNKETGLDITVPEYQEVSGRLTSHEEYHVIIISNLAYFKTVRTRQAKVVQFMVVKRYADFEQLHKALSDRYPATLFPELPRKVLMVKDSTPQERRQCFDSLMRFIAASTKVCCSHIVLNFLGVKADRIQQVEEGKDEMEKEDDDAFDGSKSPPSISPQRRSKISSSGSQQSSLFSEDPEDEMDFFKTESAASREENEGDEEEEGEEEGDLFSPTSVPSPVRNAPAKKGKYVTALRNG